MESQAPQVSMEPHVKNGFDGIQPAGLAQPVEIQTRNISSPHSNLAKIASYIFRSGAIALTLVSVVVLAIAREIVTFEFTDTTENLTVYIKSTQFSAFLYLLVANVLVFFYSIISLVVSIASKGRLERTCLLPFCIVIGDLVMIILLFSSNGAAAAVATVAGDGQSGAGWDKICNVVDGFCARVTAAIVLSMLAAVAYVLLVMVTLFRLHKRSQ